MEESSKNDFVILRRLMSAGHRKRPLLSSSSVISTSSQPLNFDFRPPNCDFVRNKVHQLDVFRCASTQYDPPASSPSTTQTPPTVGSCQGCCDQAELIRDLEFNLVESEARQRSTREYETFWRKVALSCLLSAELPVSFTPEDPPTNYKLILCSEEWFLYDDILADNDPVLCVSAKFITVSLELSEMKVTVFEKGEPRFFLHLCENRDLLKLFLVALSHSNTPVSIIEKGDRGILPSIPTRE